MKSSLYHLVIQYLKMQKKKSVLTILGIVLSVLLLVAIGVIGNHIQRTMVQQTKDISGHQHVVLKNLKEENIEIVKYHGKMDQAGVFTSMGAYRPEGEGLIVSIEGWEKEAADLYNLSANEGRFPVAEGEIILEKWLIDKLNLDVTIGDRVTFPVKQNYWNDKGELLSYEGTTSFTVVGFMNETLAKTVGGSLAITTVSTVENFLPPHVIEKDMFVKVDERFPIRETVTKLTENLKLDTDDIYMNEQLLKVMGETGQYYLPMGILALLVILAAVVTIYNIFHISIVERMKQFGMLRSIGATPTQLRKIVLLEGMLLSIIAIPLGLVFGIGLSYALIHQLTMIETNAVLLQIPTWVLLSASGLGLLTVLLSVLKPLRIASRISPLEAIQEHSHVLKNERIVEKRWYDWLTKIFGISGRMAYQNMWRNKKRTRMTLFSLSFGCVLFITFSYFTSAMDMNSVVDKYVRGDYFLKISSHYAGDHTREEFFEKEHYQKLNELDGVENVTPIKTGSIRVVMEKKQLSQKFLEDAPKNYLEANKDEQGRYLIGGDVYGYEARFLETLDKYLIAGEIPVAPMENQNLALIIDVENEFAYKPGDIIKGILPYLEDGKMEFKKVSYTVAGIIADIPTYFGSSAPGPGVIIHENQFEKNFGISGYKGFDIELDSNQNKIVIEQKLEALAGTLEKGTLISYEKQLSEIESQKRQMMLLAVSLIVVIVLISVFNIMNTMSTNIILRTRELGTLRAVGMSRVGLKKMTYLEGAFYGVISAFWGTVIGTPLAYVLYRLMKQEAGYMTWQIPWIHIGSMWMGAIIITILAVIPPIRRVAKQDIMEAVRTID